MKTPREKVLALAIAIILVFFFIYGVNVFYKEPSREDFCTDKIYENIPVNQTSCEAMGGSWETYGRVVKPVVKNNNSEGWCNPSYTCDQNYETARTNYFRTIFVIMVILGALCIVGGALVRTESIGVGFMGGGLITIIYGFVRFWRALPDFGKFILLAVVLASLLWIGVKKLNPLKKKLH